MPQLQRTWQWIKASPVAMTFLLSIALSLASLSYRASMNPDGMVHIMAGRIFIEEGFAAALKFFDWPFFSILIGIVGWVLPISYESAGYLINILMLSGACALMVKITQRYVPNSAWLACLVVLALPALNENRHNVMREDGAWFFLILAIWLAIRAPKQINLLNAVGPSVALLLAFLFRAEFVAFYPVIIIWQWYALHNHRTLANSARLFALPMLSLLAIAIAVSIFSLNETLIRIKVFLTYIDPTILQTTFDQKAALIGRHIMQPQFGQDGNAPVLAWGLTGYAFNSFLEMCYALAIPLAIGVYWKFKNHKSFAPFGALFLIYTFVLIAFVFRHYFISDRYSAPLAILCIPLITYGMYQLYAQKRKLAAYLVTILLLLNSLDNIVSTGDQDTHLVEAGHWLKEHQIPERETYIDFARIAYHADWVKYNFKFDKPSLIRRESAYRDPKIRYITLWRHVSDDELEWLKTKNLELLAEFTNSKGRKVLILKKPDSVVQDRISPASTPHSQKPNTPIPKDVVTVTSSEFVTSKTIRSALIYNNSTFTPRRGLNIFYKHPAKGYVLENYDTYASQTESDLFIKKITSLISEKSFWIVLSHDAIINTEWPPEATELLKKVGLKVLPQISHRAAYIAYSDQSGSIHELFSPDSITHYVETFER